MFEVSSNKVHGRRFDTFGTFDTSSLPVHATYSDMFERKAGWSSQVPAFVFTLFVIFVGRS